MINLSRFRNCKITANVLTINRGNNSDSMFRNEGLCLRNKYLESIASSRRISRNTLLIRNSFEWNLISIFDYIENPIIISNNVPIVNVVLDSTTKRDIFQRWNIVNDQSQGSKQHNGFCREERRPRCYTRRNYTFLLGVRFSSFAPISALLIVTRAALVSATRLSLLIRSRRRATVPVSRDGRVVSINGIDSN